MEERFYGGRQRSYGVIERADGWIELHAYHRNMSVRELLRQHAANPHYFLGRREAFGRSQTRAQFWLAEVMKDYSGHFAAGRVRMVVPPAAAGPPSERRTPGETVVPVEKEAAEAAPPGRTIALVACVGQKKARPMAARELYDSEWFHKAAAYAERAADRWYILSAKYGLVDPDTVIEPYDATLKTMPAAARRQWAGKALARLLPLLRQGDGVVILAGQAYREHLVDPIEAAGCLVEIPMEGLRIGEQLRWLNQQLRGNPRREPGGRLADVERLYEILDELEGRAGGRRVLGECDGRMGWPERGVYFFFEPGEVRTTSGKGSRVVRVGTHALKRGSKSTLWGRLRQHRGTVDFGGNHRGSIFRLHVGMGLIGRYRWPESMTETWGQGSSASRELRERERQLEKAVSWHIQHMPFLWVEVDDEPGPDSLRGTIERNAIALLSNYHREENPIDRPSGAWLGRWADREQVRRSGLWNVRHVEEEYDPGFLEVLEAAV